MRSSHRPWMIAVTALVATLGSGCDTPPLPAEVETVPSAVQAGPPGGVGLTDRLRGAERVVIGTVREVVPGFGRNEHGDRLILSRITVEVEEPLRGEAAGQVTFDLEGGTVGDLTLEVSDLPRLVPGDRGVFALRRARGSDVWVPSGRGNGILRLAPGAELEPVRQAAGASR